jgi:mono/diheme cytochrome c family protein
MRSLRAFFGALVVAAAVAITACDTQSKEEVIPIPERTISAATFDTVAWQDEAAQLARGKDVFGWVCAKCHGIYGRGDGGEVIDGDTIHPPSFLDPQWRFATDERALEQRIFLGNNRGMPHWGEQGLQPRDIVAVAAFIQQDLRKNAPPGVQDTVR